MDNMINFIPDAGVLIIGKAQFGQREVAAANPATTLVDVDSLLATNEIPGDRWFVDHVHFSFAGSCALARLWLDPAAHSLAADQERHSSHQAQHTARLWDGISS